MLPQYCIFSRQTDAHAHTHLHTHTVTLHQLFGLKEALEVPHLPDAYGHQYDGLDDGPPEDSLVRAFAGLAETLLPVLEGQIHTHS